MGIGGGNGRAQAATRSSFVRSVGEAEDVLRTVGYDGISFEAVGREVRATSYNARGHKAQALGRNNVIAAQQLVRVITRP